MDATRRQRTLRATVLIGIGLLGAFLLSLDPLGALRDPAFLVMAGGLSLWTIVENLVLKQDEPADYRGKRNTRIVQAAVMVGVFVASIERSHLPALGLPRSTWFVVAGGVVLLLGAALRIWSIRTLDRHFRYELRVEGDQALVRKGPYRVVRHPSYLGLLLLIGGATIAMSSALGFVAGVGMATAALVVRIREEEQVLRDSFGGAYDAYEDETWRLVPYVY